MLDWRSLISWSPTTCCSLTLHTYLDLKVTSSEHLELLPRLASGVFMHVHDIVSPRDYPDGRVRRDVLVRNEQYLLGGLLSDSDRYEFYLGIR